MNHLKVGVNPNKSFWSALVTLPVTPHFQFDLNVTGNGAAAIAAMATVCEQDYQTLKDIYGLGDPPGLPFRVHVDETAGGAYHLSCAGTEIWLISEDAPTLLMAEVDEVFQAMTGTWDCGQVNGEGHSRVMAEVIRPATLITGIDGDVQGWWNNGNPYDWVNDNSGTDQNQESNACGSLFLYWLNSLDISGHPVTWKQITANGASTLGGTYSKLTGKSGQEGFKEFTAALNAIQQPWSDNPFVGGTPNPNPTPLPVPVPTGKGCNPFGRFMK